MTGSSNAWKRWGTAIGTVIVMVVGVLGAPPASAAPAAPRNLSPSSTSSLTSNPVLQWDRVRGASSYNVEVSATDSFDTLVYKATTTNRRATPTVQLPAGTVWWRVRGVGSSGAGTWAETSFRRNAVAGPNPLSPVAGVTLEQPSAAPLLSWSAVNGATGYEIEIDGAEGDFVGATPYTTKTTSLVVPNPQENGLYWWRVRAVQGSGLSTLWSAERSYTVGPLPVVGEATPAISARVNDVVFDWAPVPGAISYDIRVSPDDSFNSATMIETRVVKGTRYSPPTTYDNDQYWWQVRARNIYGKAQEWSEVPIRTFQRDWLEAPNLLHPADSLAPAGDDLYFQWSPVHLATRYRLDIGTDENFSPDTYESCFTTETTYTPGHVEPTLDKCMPAPGVTYYWRVQALDGPRSPQVNGIYSQSRRLVYSPGPVTQLSPLSGTTVDVPTFTWEAAKHAVEYRVRVTWSGGSKTEITKSLSWTPTGSALDPAKGPFTWTVQSVDDNEHTSPLPLFGGETFSVSGDLPTTGATPLTPLTPVEGAAATARFPALTWEPVDGAHHYKLYVGTAGGTFFQTVEEEFPYPAATDISANFLTPGSYDWFVSAHRADDSRIGSPGAKGTFTIKTLAPVTGQQVALDGSGIDSGAACDYFLDDPSDTPKLCGSMRGTAVLDWQPVPDAGLYMIYLSRDREFTNLVLGSKSSPSTIPATVNTMWNPTLALPDSQAGDAYYWFIRPCKTRTLCAADPTRALHAFDKLSNRVQRTSPAAGATVANDVTFTWNDYLDTNQLSTSVNPTTNEKSGQAARSYHIQVSTSSAFTTLVDEATVDQKTYTAFNRTYPEGQLYWRVQAVDGAGNGLAWSPAWGFTKKSPTVTLQAPADESTVTSTQPFRWTPLHFAASYDIEVYKNADRTASSANRVLSANSKQVAFSPPTPLAASSTAYVWRVRRVDVDGKKGDWSGWSWFKVTGSAPELVAPASSVFTSASNSLFTWRAVGGAMSYKFERRNTGSTSIDETVTTASLAWAPTRTIPDGTWAWRVTALDANKQPIASSAWRNFSVDGARPAVVGKSPVTTASRTTSFVAKFSEPVRGVNGTSVKLYVKGQQHPLTAKVTLSANRRTATLNPARNLRSGKFYTVRLRSTIKDRAGNTLPATAWSATAK